MKTDILVLDSGVLKEHPALKNGTIDYLFDEQHDKDHNGHGTAVTGIINIQVPENRITVGRVLDSDGECTKESLIEALQYIYEFVECKILHLSLGIREDSKELYDICKKIREKGIIIVAAFDNAGGISYPAAYTFVIGVDASIRCKKYDDFVYVRNSIVNLKAKGGVQRLAWLDNSYVIAQGASFAAAYVSAQILRTWDKTKGIYDKILYEFSKNAKYTYDFEKINTNTKMKDLSFIHKAAIFPYNKETQGIFSFQDMLSFDIEAIYDFKYSGNIGRKVSSFDNNFTMSIQNIEEMSKKDIDTLIIGHLFEAEALMNCPIKRQVLEKCLKRGINVFMFDNREADIFEPLFEKAGLQFVVAAETIDVIGNNFGKLFSPSAPVLGVFGTTSKQGKFTLQMEIRRRMLRDSYRVAQIGTEPSAQLFGMEAYPFGYDADSKQEFSGINQIAKLNAMIHKMDLEKPDIIIVGSQSGTTPMLYDNLGQITLNQIIFLLGTLPDGVILCVNYNDDISYIERTIETIHGVADTKVIALAVYPKYYKNGWQFANARQSKAEEGQLKQYAYEVQVKFGIKVFVMNEFQDYEEIYRHCIRTFEE